MLNSDLACEKKRIPTPVVIFQLFVNSFLVLAKASGLSINPKSGKIPKTYRTFALYKVYSNLYVHPKEIPPSAKIVGISF
jgi:hypothetical protein